MSKLCEIIQDLLPLYVDGACSEASGEMVGEHLQVCPACREIHQKMSAHTDEEILQREKDGVIVRHERKEDQKILHYLFLALGLIYFPMVFLAAWLSKADGTFIILPYSFKLMVVAFYSFPWYMVFVEVGLTVCRLIERGHRGRLEKIFYGIEGILTLSIVAVALALDNDAQLIPALVLSGLLCLCLLIGAIVCKKKPRFDFLMKKTFWLCLLLLTAVVALALAIPTVILSVSNVREEYVDTAVSAGVREYGSDVEGVRFEIDIAEQHEWDLIGKDPYIVAKWVNESGADVLCDGNFYLYKQTGDGWGLCSTDYVGGSAEPFTLKFGESSPRRYSLQGYDLGDGGLFKFVAFVNGEAVWFTFEVKIEHLVNANGEYQPRYRLAEDVMVIENLTDLDADREEVLSRYERGDMIVVLDMLCAYEVQSMVRRSVAVTFDESLQAVIFYQINGTPGTYELTGNSSDTHREIDACVEQIRGYKALNSEKRS